MMWNFCCKNKKTIAYIILPNFTTYFLTREFLVKFVFLLQKVWRFLQDCYSPWERSVWLTALLLSDEKNTCIFCNTTATRKTGFTISQMILLNSLLTVTKVSRERVRNPPAYNFRTFCELVMKKRRFRLNSLEQLRQSHSKAKFVSWELWKRSCSRYNLWLDG